MSDGGQRRSRAVRIARAALIAALGATVFGMMALTAVDVAGRYLFNAPLGGAKELTEILLALMVFGAAPLVTATRTHITTALFESALKGAALLARNIVVAGISSMCCGVLAWRLWAQGDAMRDLAGGTPLLGVPLAPVFYAMAVLAAICAAIALMPGAARPAAELPDLPR